jgi:hypothetical protein
MSPSTTSQVATLAAVLIASGCRFGGPSGDPSLPGVDGSSVGGGQAGQAGTGGQAGQAGTGGQGGQAGTGGQAGQAGSGGGSGEGGGTDAGGSAGATPDARDDIVEDAMPDGGVDRDASWDDVRADADAASDGESPDSAPPTMCVPPFSSAVCDPVCNTGCTPLLRCDVTDTPRTGVCVGTLLSTVPEGMACMRTTATDDCLERLTCVERICRRLCYRDSDCVTSGTCCNIAIDVDAGPSGYRICAPCGP